MSDYTGEGAFAFGGGPALPDCSYLLTPTGIILKNLYWRSKNMIRDSTDRGNEHQTVKGLTPW